jgi:hypothetical protein
MTLLFTAPDVSGVVTSQSQRRRVAELKTATARLEGHNVNITCDRTKNPRLNPNNTQEAAALESQQPHNNVLIQFRRKYNHRQNTVRNDRSKATSRNCCAPLTET